MNDIFEMTEVIEDEVVSIEEYDVMDTIDIEVDSRGRLFFANDILTHNSGWDSSDLSISDVSESAALLHTVDMIFGIITNPEMKAKKEYYLKCLASRVSGYENTKKRYTIEWEYGRIDEDRGSQIMDMDYVTNTVSTGGKYDHRKADRKGNVAYVDVSAGTVGGKAKTEVKAKDILVEDLDSIDFGSFGVFNQGQ